ncbi:MAG: cobalamin biosynthesis protein CobD [Candidatus Rokubacteria bacterium]|nr:cobalamin biosynthesis protein CobD [Candidatus Rokubacteria bacterium]
MNPIWRGVFEPWLILALAVLLDLALGEPANRWHPVAWVGRGLAWARERGGKGGPAFLMCYGALAMLGVALLVTAVVAGLVHVAQALGWLGVLLQAWLLKCAFAVKGLVLAAGEVRNALASGQFEEARRLVGRSLVSRPTAALSAEHVASATVESVAENLTDSVVAPLFFYLLFGLPGAWAYRVINTADAMWGYREGELEYLGKPAALLDDLLNWVPARLAGLAIVVGAFVSGEAARDAWRTMVLDHSRTASPNAGWTMAAMAGALGVALEKPGAYRLGAGELPGVACIDRALRVLMSASAIAVLVSVILAELTR